MKSSLSKGTLAIIWIASFVLGLLVMAGGHSLAFTKDPLSGLIPGIGAVFGGDWESLLWLPILLFYGAAIYKTVNWADRGKKAWAYGAAIALAVVSLVLGSLGWIPNEGSGSLLFVAICSSITTGIVWFTGTDRFTDLISKRETSRTANSSRPTPPPIQTSQPPAPTPTPQDPPKSTQAAPTPPPSQNPPANPPAKKGFFSKGKS